MTDSKDSSSDADVEKAEDKHRGYAFGSTLHLLLFILICTSSQLFTQLTLGNLVFPLRTVTEDLGISQENAVWGVASYSIGVGSVVLISGQLGDIYGKKLCFIAGWIWLTICCIVLGTVKQSTVFILFRALAGIAPGFLLPNAAALLGAAFPPGKVKVAAFGLFGYWAPTGFFLGGLWGGLCAQFGHWQWTYRSECIFTALIAVSAYFIVPHELNTKDKSASFDYLGSAIGVSSLGLIFFSITSGATTTWTRPYNYILLIAGVLLMVLFVLVERRVKHPVLPMRLFADPVFGAVAAADLFGWMSFGTYAYYTPQLQTQLRGLTYMGAILQWIPICISGGIAIIALSYAMPRYPAWVIFGTSMVCFCIGALLLSFQEIDQSYWALTFPAMVIICWGPEWSFASSSLILSDAVEQRLQGVAGSFINTITNVAIGLGLALAGNVEVGVNKGGTDPLLGYRGAWWFSVGAAALGILIVVALHSRMQQKGGGH